MPTKKSDLEDIFEPKPDRASYAAQCRKNPFLRKKVLEFAKESGLAADVKDVLGRNGVSYESDAEKKLVTSAMFAFASVALVNHCQAIILAMLASAKVSGHSNDCGHPECPIALLKSDDHPIHILERLRSLPDSPTKGHAIPALPAMAAFGAVKTGEA